MAKMINRDEAVKRIKERADKWSASFYGTGLMGAIEIIRDIPTVDAVEVVHGRCKKSENREEWYTYEYTCLECGATMMVADIDGYDIAPNYCPNCGAKYGW